MVCIAAPVLQGTSQWKQVKPLPGQLPAVNEAQGRWKAREKFQSGLADEASYPEKLTRSRCGTGSVSTGVASVLTSPTASAPTSPGRSPLPSTPCSSIALPKSLFRTSVERRWSLSTPRKRLSQSVALSEVAGFEGLETLTSRMKPTNHLEQAERYRTSVMQASFTAADKDRDNKLSRAEFSLMLRRAFPEITRQEIDKEWAMADCNCDNIIGFKEFVNWLRPEDEGIIYEADPMSHKPLLVVFRLIDLAESGSITQPELEFLLTQAKANLKQQEVDVLFSLMHPAQNGEISFDDFVHFLFPPVNRASERSLPFELLPAF